MARFLGGPMITNDAFLFGILALMLGGVFYTSTSNIRFWKKFAG